MLCYMQMEATLKYIVLPKKFLLLSSLSLSHTHNDETCACQPEAIKETTSKFTYFEAELSHNDVVTVVHHSGLRSCSPQLQVVVELANTGMPLNPRHQSFYVDTAAHVPRARWLMAEMDLD